MILAFISLCVYACISGVKDAILWSRKGAESFKWNEHIVFVAERVAVVSLLFSSGTLQQEIITIACWLGCFSFLHNGFYYEARKRIDVPDYHFWSNSATSTATLELNSNIRTLLFISSLIVFFVFIV